MQIVYTDGGRRDAGYKGDAGDCVTRAIALALYHGGPVTNTPRAVYQMVYDALKQRAATEKVTSRTGTRSSVRDGVRKSTYKQYLRDLGFEWTPTMFIGSGCKVHLKDGELPMGILVVEVSKHLTCVIDGAIFDSHDPARDGTRCVYGYWQKKTV